MSCNCHGQDLLFFCHLCLGQWRTDGDSQLVLAILVVEASVRKFYWSITLFFKQALAETTGFGRSLDYAIRNELCGVYMD